MEISDVVRVINEINSTSDIKIIENPSENNDERDDLYFSFKRETINYLCKATVEKNKTGKKNVKKVDFSVIVKVSSYMPQPEILPMLNKLNMENENGCSFFYLKEKNQYVITTQSRILRDNSYSKTLKKSDNGEVISSNLFLSWKIQLLESILYLIKSTIDLFEAQKKHNKENQLGFDNEKQE